MENRLTMLQKEISDVQQSGSKEDFRRFLKRHPILSALGLIYMAAGWFLRACLWTLVLLLVVVGLKVLWLAVLYAWRLV